LKRIAIDLDEPPGVPLIDGPTLVGWQMRPGCAEPLDHQQSRYSLLLWSVSPAGADVRVVPVGRNGRSGVRSRGGTAIGRP
jgi:hypothetical protein